jgi:hypothetical protein
MLSAPLYLLAAANFTIFTASDETIIYNTCNILSLDALVYGNKRALAAVMEAAG